MAEPASHEQWVRAADEAAARAAGLRLILQAAAAAQAQRGVFRIALSGGNTPRKLYEAWRHAEGVDWQHIEIFWGDERAVPAHDPHSNYRMAREALLDHVPIAAANIHRMPADAADLDQAAADYEATLRSRLEPDGRLDVVLLGLGEDAHTASLFPRAASLSETRRWVVATPAPVIAPRLTGTAPLFNAARQIVFLVCGASKRAALARVRRGSDDPSDVPALLIQPRSGRLTWLVDAAAAGEDDSLP